MRHRVGIAAVVLLAACGTTSQERKRTKAAESARVDVQIVAREVMNNVQDTARRITNLTEDREVRRTMITWQINTLDYCQRALQRPDPRLAFVDIWTLLEQTRAFVKDERGKKLLGAQQPVALEALDGMVGRLEQRARSLLSKTQFEQVDSAIDTYVRQRMDEGEEIAHPPVSTSSDSGMLSVILAVPEGIFSLGGGVKDTAVSISEVARATEQGVGVVSTLPQMARWQTELLLFAIEENETVERLVANLDRTSHAVAAVGETARALPAKVEEATMRAIREVEGTQPEFRKTLDEGRKIVEEGRRVAEESRKAVEIASGAIDKIDPLLESAKENGKWIETAAGRATEAGAAWEGAFGQLNLLVNPPVDPRLPPPEPSPPFDMKDLVTTAEHATVTAENVRAAVEDLRAVVEGQATDRVASAVGATIDRVTTRAIAVIVVFFTALLAYRLAARRFAK